MANRPNQHVSPPVSRRHRYRSIGLKSPVKNTNSVAMPWVDMTEDVRLIREGYRAKLPNNRWSINGRVYVREDKPQGTMYPESGDDIVSLKRSQYRALTFMPGYSGDSARADFELQSNPSISEEDIRVAREVVERARNK